MRRDVYIEFELAVERATALVSWGYRVTFYGDLLYGKHCWIIEFSK